MLQGLRDIPERIIPYAASTALTRSAKIAATIDVPNAMRQVFDRPVPYVLKSTYIEPATKTSLRARVAVKTDTYSGGTVPEDFLLPSVHGGGRNEKRFERALRYAGYLPSGWRLIQSPSAPVDSFGNIPLGVIQQILTALRANIDPYQNRSNSARSRKNARNAPYFAITPYRGFFEHGEYKQVVSRTQPGIYKRTGAHTILPIFIFTSKLPQYRKRLDFEKICEASVNANFRTEFLRAVDEIQSRGARS